MKIIIAFLFIILINTIGSAQPIDESTLKIVAINFYNYISKQKINQGNIKKFSDNYYKNTLTYSTVIFKNNDWIVLSRDKKAEPILAYSLEQSYSLSTNPNAKYLFNQYDKYVYETISNIDTDNILENAIEWENLLSNNFTKYLNEKANIVVEPLINTKWGQSESNSGNDPNAYNYYAPPDINCDHSLAGCPAIAMGQILRYWQYPTCNEFIWSNMPNTLDVTSTNYETNKNEIASMLRNLGDKMQTVMGNSHNYYGCDASGTNTDEAILYPLITNFFYQSAEIVERNNYGINEWKDILCIELDANRPILYTGFSNNGGHAFICDGYSKPLLGKKFHFNFGWNGDNDGFYRISDNGYPNNQSAIINIYPSDICSSHLTIYDFFRYFPFSNKFYNPIAGYIYSSPSPIVISNFDVVTYKAYREIILENFETQDEADFTAEIISCPFYCDFINYKYLKNSLIKTDSIKNLSEIKIYPNPSSGIFNVEYDKILLYKIDIINCLGNLVYSKVVNENITKVDISDQPNGFYIFKLYTSETNFQLKILKQ